MVFFARRVLILLICMGLLLSVQPDKVSGLRSIDLVLRQNQHNQGMVPQNQRILKETTMVGKNAEKKSTKIHNKFDPNQSSKRRVRRGSDPIHNRPWYVQVGCSTKEISSNLAFKETVSSNAEETRSWWVVSVLSKNFYEVGLIGFTYLVLELLL